MVLLLEQLVEFVERLLLHVGLLEDVLSDLGQRGIARPDFGGRAQFGFHRGAVAGHGRVFRFGQMHGADRFGCFDFGQRLARVEIRGHAGHVVDQLLRAGQVVDLEGGEQFVFHLGELEGLAFVFAGEETDARHEFAEGESLGKALRGAVQLALFEEELVGLDALVDVADGLVGQAVDLAEGADQFAHGLRGDGRTAGQAFHTEVFQAHLHPAGREGAPAAAAHPRAVAHTDIGAVRSGFGSDAGAAVGRTARGGDLRIEFGIDPRLPGVLVDRQRLDHLFVNVDRVVAVLVDRAVEAVGDEDVLEAARREVLHDERLQVAARVQLGEGDAQFVVLDGLGHVG